MAGSTRPDTQAGLDAFNRGDAETALRLWKKAAEADSEHSDEPLVRQRCCR